MSEEEKKAIEIIESTLLGLDDKNILLNLIEKQQKELDKKEHEIKELKKQLIALTYKSSVKGNR